MTKRMLIDATHREETRVAVVDGDWLVDFDYESKYRKQLKGNIYLAKVTRVEPSLQAAFVDFGGNRHGFLPFNEIHPDYFRLPIADREALLAEQEEEMQAIREREEAEENAIDNDTGDSGEQETGPDDDGQESESDTDPDDPRSDSEEEETSGGPRKNKKGGRKGRVNADSKSAENKSVETVGGAEDVENDRPPRPSIKRNYKIQEVIKRGQIMLVQVQKEERGNKGAAVSSYLSLPGRYCVLMPNSPRSGGVSRKVASVKDRKRMREILRELSVPEGMSVIMRTAGLSRNKSEIKRDLDYLMRLWDSIRDLTLKSTAPTLVYEEGNLIKRAIRDLYKRDIEDIQVAGDDGYREAKNFIKMLVPSHAKRVRHYKHDKIPLFHRYQVETQISEMGNTQVTLQSGGYLVINPTEALVSVDVNSGRATKERNIEETALRTNLEAADEVARQLRLRDLGGLVVIDFIDMDDRRNNAKVEKRLRDALSHDRARIQVGKISNFGLLELSRQRLNPSLTEAQFQACEHCQGTGHVRTTDSAAILALRALEEEGINERADQVILHLPNAIALYILNNKRDMLIEIEQRYGYRVSIRVDEALAPAEHVIEPVKHPAGDNDEDTDEVVDGSGITLSESYDNDTAPAKTPQRKSPKRDNGNSGDKGAKSGGNTNADKGDKSEDKGDDKGRGGSRRRGRRGGRRRNRRNEQQDEQTDEQNRQQEDKTAGDDQQQAVEAGAGENKQAGKTDDKDSTGSQSGSTKTSSAKSGGAKSKSAAKSVGAKSSGSKSGPAKSTSTKSAGKSTSKGSQGSTKSKSSKSGTAKTSDDTDGTRQAGSEDAQNATVQTSEPAGETAAQTAESDTSPSNDDAQQEQAQAQAQSAGEETASQKKPKKKGWWNRLIES